MVVIVRAVEEVLVDTVDKGRPTPTRGANDPKRREERTDQGVMVFTKIIQYFFSQCSEKNILTFIIIFYVMMFFCSLVFFGLAF